MTIAISKSAFSLPTDAVFTSPLSKEANGSFAFHSGCSRASTLMRLGVVPRGEWIGLALGKTREGGAKTQEGKESEFHGMGCD